jgi:hypothetical protein
MHGLSVFRLGETVDRERLMRTYCGWHRPDRAVNDENKM